ncbi:MAG TPA: hypothetical protein VFM46_14045 [Pseudomonadales bacterium]|nr:hypothetical protein [Pseudomonadales bacterium]
MKFMRFLSVHRASLRLRHVLAAVLSAAGLINPVWADSAAEAPRVSWSGFLSQAVYSTSDNDFFGYSDDKVAWDYREVGLIGRAMLTDRTDFSAQLLSRRAGLADDGSPRIDYAFFTYDLANSVNLEQGLRLGKVKSPVGFYNDTREVPFTRSGILLPQGIYYDRLRNSAFSTYSLQYFADYRGDLSSLSLKLQAGQLIVDSKELSDLVGFRQLNGKGEPKESYQFALFYDYDASRIRAGFTFSEGHFIFKPHYTNFLYADGSVNFLNAPGNVRNSQAVFSLEYNALDWSVTSEIAEARVRVHGFNSIVPTDFEDQPFAIYVQGIYRISEKWDVLARYDESHLDHGDWTGKKYEEIYKTTVGGPAFTRYTKDMTFGAGWKPSHDLMIRGELHVVEGTSWISIRYSDSYADYRKYWNMALIQLSYRF